MEEISITVVAVTVGAYVGYQKMRPFFEVVFEFGLALGGELLMQIARIFGSTVLSLSVLYAGYNLLRQVIDAAVKKALGRERDDQKGKDIKPGSLHDPLHCSTDEGFLQAGIKVNGLKVEIENKAEDDEKKEVTEKRSHIKRNICEDVKNTDMDDVESSMKKNRINKARSLALRFMSGNPNCIKAIPYESEDSQSLTMCLYMDTNGRSIPEEVKSTAKKMFENYEIKFVDLLQLPLKKVVTQPSLRKNFKKLDEISRKIEKNLHLFENRMNVTAVQASYKVTDSIEQDIPCVTVYVLGKGRIPAGETGIKEIKGDNGYLFQETAFDVAEGYYKLTNGSSLEGYAKHLQAGVGIGVEGVNAAGTLGGFLEDETGKVYILSNEHVLHPPEAGDMKVIVQPSKLDYDDMLSKSERNLNWHTEKINENLTTSNQESNSVLEETERDLMNEKERMKEIERGQPRRIAKYVYGVKDNYAVGDIKVYVDAAIAELDENQSFDMKKHKKREARCPLYGFETKEYWNQRDSEYQPPNGEIIDFQTFQEHVRTEREVQEQSGKPSELRFMKIGKSTGFTDEGCFDIPQESTHIHFMHSKDIHGLVHMRHSLCEDCFQLKSPNHPPSDEEDESNIKKCINCEREFQNPGQIKSFWARNCYLVKKRRKPFSEEGDSGALVFDKEGRAWGLANAYFDTFTPDLLSVMSPLCVALDALKQKSGKKELKLWST